MRIPLIRLSLVLFLLFTAPSLATIYLPAGNPNAILLLDEFQTYEIGVSTKVQHSFGKYDNQGRLWAASRDRMTVVSFASAKRFTENLQGYLNVPVVYREKHLGSLKSASGFLGDVAMGVRWNILSNIFDHQWHPSIHLLAELKFPTGSNSSLTGTKLQVGTGNGLWEPRIGLEVQKFYSRFLLAIETSYVMRLGDDRFRAVEGLFDNSDHFLFIGRAQYNLAQRLLVGVGIKQKLGFDGTLRGIKVSQSAPKTFSGTAAITYLFNRLWSLQLSLDSNIPIRAFNANTAAARSLTLRLSYGIF